MILRLTSSSLAGTSRKLVAVGTARLRSMLATMAAPAPRIGSPRSPAGASGAGGAGAAAVGAGAVGAGADAPLAGAAVGGGAGMTAGAAGAVATATTACGGPAGSSGSPRRTPASSRSPRTDRLRYCSYISSTSQALGPRRASRAPSVLDVAPSRPRCCAHRPSPSMVPAGTRRQPPTPTPAAGLLARAHLPPVSVAAMTNFRTAGLLISVGRLGLLAPRRVREQRGRAAGPAQRAARPRLPGRSWFKPRTSSSTRRTTTHRRARSRSTTGARVSSVHDLVIYDKDEHRRRPDAPGQSGQEEVGTYDLPAGTYTLVCDIPGHKEAGMVATLTTK